MGQPPHKIWEPQGHDQSRVKTLRSIPKLTGDQRAAAGNCTLPRRSQEPNLKRYMSSYLNVNCAICTVPSIKVTVINLQVPFQDFDVCQL